MGNRVEAQKPTEAFNGIFICGEAPGETEEKKGVPFVGAAGMVLDGMLEEVEIRRQACYITNYVKERPSGNNFHTVTQEALAKYKAELQEEISIVQPNIIVPMGEHALNALTDCKGITNWRGSVLERAGYKILPTIHPAAILCEWKFRPMVVCDLLRAKKESKYRDRRVLQRELIIYPSTKEVLDFLQGIRVQKQTCAFDIETETSQISCISFATSSTCSMCIPFWFGASGSIFSEEDERQIWASIASVLIDPDIKKIAQNGQYDMTILRDKYGIRVQGLWLDTMIAFHAIYPELPKSLAFLTSIYTDVAYYKYYRTTNNMDDFFRYNATDSVVTYECAMKIYKEMEEFHVVDFYYEHMHSLIDPLMHICNRGVRIDTPGKKQAIKEVNECLEGKQQRLNELVGHELNVNSPKQMATWLYVELKLPVVYNKESREKGLTKERKNKLSDEDKFLIGAQTDEETLMDLHAKTGNEALKVVLDIRGARKLLSTYLEVTYDKINGVERARTSYLITGTETGRLSSRETVYGTGTNMQNIPKGIVRRIFIPDEGKVFLNADFSQAEARVVAWLAGEDRLIKIFQDGGDIHRRNASKIYRKAEEDVTKAEREIAKRIVHASNYGMGPVTFARNAGLTVAESKRLLNAYFAEFPRIKLWHMSIQRDLRNTRTLTTPMGRKRTFFNRWNDSLIKEALAYIPQSTVADLLNMGLRRVYAEYKDSPVEILLQIHDAILLQVPVNEISNVAASVRRLLTIPIEINHKELVLPVDISVGENWDALKKYVG